MVSMPFKRAVVLLSGLGAVCSRVPWFQCPLSGQLCCCNTILVQGEHLTTVSMPFKRAVVLLSNERVQAATDGGFNAL